MRQLSILGSTGSIGTSAVSLLLNELKGMFEVQTLSFHSNAGLAFTQAMELKPKKVIATSKQGYEELVSLVFGKNVSFKIEYGLDALREDATNSNASVVLLAMVGAIGFEFSVLFSSNQNTKILAIANKEAILCAGHLILQNASRLGKAVIPVDSEHNSIYRLLQNTHKIPKSMFITASGGPFAGKNFNSLEGTTPKQASMHPVWQMGQKILIDSATMANKGIELIEAYILYNMPPHTINAFICKGSLVHAGVSFEDGSSTLFASRPSMRLHIANAISGGVFPLNQEPIDFANLQFVFEEIKPQEFPIFFIAKQVVEGYAFSKNHSHIIAFNIINELAVQNFLEGKIKYTQILTKLEENLKKLSSLQPLASTNEITTYINYIKEEYT